MKFSISKLVAAAAFVVCVAAFVLASVAAVSAEEVLGQGGPSGGVESSLIGGSAGSGRTGGVVVESGSVG
jgi:hypothetical protein